MVELSLVLSLVLSFSLQFLVLKLEKWHMVRNKDDGGKVGRVSFSFAQCTNGIINEIFL